MTQTVLQSIFFYTALTNVLKSFYKGKYEAKNMRLCLCVCDGGIDFLARKKLEVELSVLACLLAF